MPDAGADARRDATGSTDFPLPDVTGLQGRLAVLERATAFAAAVETIDGPLESVLNLLTQAAGEVFGAKRVAIDMIGGGEQSRYLLQSGVEDRAIEPVITALRERGSDDPARGEWHSEPSDLPEKFIRVTVPIGTDQQISLVGTPIESGGRWIGTLFRDEPTELGESLMHAFELMARVSTIIGRVIAHAVSLIKSDMETRWINAASTLTMTLLEGDTDLPLSLITDVAAAATVTDVVMLTTVKDGHVELLASSGSPAVATDSFHLHSDGSLTERVMQSGEALFVEHHSGDSIPSFEGASVVVAPLDPRGDVRGALCLIRQEGTARFTHREIKYVEMFAHRASLALELVEGRNVRTRLAVLERQNQIAQDLHSHVIREIFGTGMNLQSLARRLTRSDQAKEVQAAILALDEVIVKIRALIFGLQSDSDAGRTSIERRLPPE